MTDGQSKIWIDMTDLSSWKGHLTGIQRVVYNVALHYAEQGNVDYFTYDDKTNKFYPFDFNGLAEQIRAQAASTGVVSVERSRARIIFHTMKNIVPENIRSKINPKWKSRAKNTYLKSKTISIVMYQRLLKHGDDREQIQFRPEDTILILGNSWDKPSILTQIQYIKAQTGFKLYQLVYDLIPVFEPQSFNTKLYKKYTNHIYEVITSSDGLMAISESTKSDLLRFCKETRLPEPRVEVIRLGDEIVSVTNPTHPQKVLETENFILCVGTIEARKNHALLYYTWKRAKERGVSLPKLVIVGRPGWFTSDVLHYIELDSVTRNDFIILQNASDSELSWLYDNCLFTVYPSSYEGWGLPIAESLAYGKVCIPANSSSMTEIAGDLLDYFSPYSTDECLDVIIKYLDKKERASKEKAIKDGYTITTWEETYQQVKSIVQ